MNNILDKIDLKVLGNRLKQARCDNNLLLSEVSQKTSLSFYRLNEIEQGLEKIDNSELIELARFYGKSVNSLVSKPLKFNIPCQAVEACKNGDITVVQLKDYLNCDLATAQGLVGREIFIK